MTANGLAYGLLLGVGLLGLVACGSKDTVDAAAEAPPPARVQNVGEGSLITVDHPERFALAEVQPYDASPTLEVTGVVSADVSRTVPVVSLASGRVVEIHARLGDTVRKGQLLMKVQSADIAQAFSEFRQATADAALAQAQLDRAKLLYDKGAIAQKDLEIAQDAQEKARVAVETAGERLRVLGADARHPSALVDITAPVSGVITEQNVTAAAGVKTLDNSPNLFTISDLSRVWVLCDVYENDLPAVQTGELAGIQLNAYPGHVYTGRISDIGHVLDPATRSAKVRIEVANPGVMRVGMFVTAILHGAKKERRAQAPASAVLHLHDRDWVFMPAGNGRFERREVQAGAMLPDRRQEIRSGVEAGQRVAADALVLQNTVEQ